MTPARAPLLLLFACVVPLVSRADRAAPQSLACTNVQGSMGNFYRWATPNPGMVAPVMFIWHYPTYRNPLASSFTGKSIALTIPGSYGQNAGFHLGKSAVPTATDPKYRLTRVELRKPPVAYSGLGMALSHVMEMVLVHKEINGDSWANVILPFQVSTSGADVDIINPIINLATLPSKTFETGYVMSSAIDYMALAPGFDGAEFSTFWGTAPAAGCPSKTVNVRYLMRTSTLAIGVDTFQQLSNALENVPAQEPDPPPTATWILGSCQNNTGKCVLPKAKDIKVELSNLKNAESQAITEQRARKKDLDTKLIPVKKHVGPANKTSIANFQAAVVAYNDLKAAASELTSAESQVAKVQQQVDEAKKYKWDYNEPKAAKVTTTKKAALLVDVAAQPKLRIEGASRQAAQRSDCAALGQSPVDIDTRRVVDVSSLSPALAEPLAFRYMSSTESTQAPRLQFSHHGHYLRVAVPPGSSQWPLGGVLSQGVLRGVSHVDIHVPGEHAVDGRVPAAELQLVHESVGGRPATAVAVPLELDGSSAEDGGRDNAWLLPLLNSLPTADIAKDVLGQPLGLLHAAMNSGQTSYYYRYDGSLTKPPCLPTEWFVLTEPGRLSFQQLADLKAVLNTDAASQAHHPFMTSLVMRGSPRLVGPVEAPEMGAMGSNFLSSFRARRRVQI